MLEDDVDFVDNFNAMMEATISQLNNISWDFFYGGYRASEELQLATAHIQKRGVANKNICPINSYIEIECSHFFAVNKSTIAFMTVYLEEMMMRPEGHAEGGRMHVDGAYNWFRRAHSNVQTWIATPVLCYQRSSRTDIHDLKWYDTMPILNLASGAIRKIKNQIAYSR